MLAELLQDRQAVHINMLRGSIAKLSPAQIGHLYRGDEAREVIAEVARQNGIEWTVVPKNPTPAMIAAGNWLHAEDGEVCYRAMIAAAPFSAAPADQSASEGSDAAQVEGESSRDRPALSKGDGVSSRNRGDYGLTSQPSGDGAPTPYSPDAPLSDGGRG